MTDDFPPVAEVAAKVAELNKALGAPRACDVEGCWEHQIDEHWFVAVNGHKEEQALKRSNGGGVTVPPFHFYLEFNGWPAGFLTPFGGTMAAGEAANEQTLIAALDAAIAKASGANGKGHA